MQGKNILPEECHCVTILYHKDYFMGKTYLRLITVFNQTAKHLKREGAPNFRKKIPEFRAKSDEIVVIKGFRNLFKSSQWVVQLLN